jgi:hypothetical protein
VVVATSYSRVTWSVASTPYRYNKGSQFQATGLYNQLQMAPAMLCGDTLRGKNLIMVKLTVAYDVTSRAETGKVRHLPANKETHT